MLKLRTACTLIFISLVMSLFSFTGIIHSQQNDVIHYTVENTAVNQVNDNLFGQFLERASWGEPGPEGAVIPGKGELQPEVARLIKDMRIPVIRFPGGGDVDYVDWLDMIDNAPGRKGGRPVSKGQTGKEITNAFGYDEFLRYTESIKVETILVLNLRDGLAKNKPLKEAALHAAGLVAYCNAQTGLKLPAGMPDWPGIRAKNGHPKPYKVKYIQIGNEVYLFSEEAFKKAGILSSADKKDWYVQCVREYVNAIKAVDPSVSIIIEGGLYADEVYAAKDIRDKINYVAYHSYTPWAIQQVSYRGKPIQRDKLKAEDVWYAWVGVPSFDIEGRAAFDKPFLDSITKRFEGKWKIAQTEWNWNGWTEDSGKYGKITLDSLYAKGIGAAGYLNAFIRAGNTIEIATQSNLIGTSWDIGAVRVDPKGEIPPYYHPTGMVTSLYSRYHGNSNLLLKEKDVPTYSHQYRMGQITPKRKVQVVDSVVTSGNKALYFHAINRDFSKDRTISIDLSTFKDIKGTVKHHMLLGRLNNKPLNGEPIQVARFADKELTFDKKVLTVTLPKMSVSVIEIEKGK